MCSHKDSVPSLVPKYKVETLYSGTGSVPEFWRGYQEKRCVHIGARRRIEPGHGARAPSVNTALADCSTRANEKDPLVQNEMESLSTSLLSFRDLTVTQRLGIF